SEEQRNVSAWLSSVERRIPGAPTGPALRDDGVRVDLHVVERARERAPADVIADLHRSDRIGPDRVLTGERGNGVPVEVDVDVPGRARGDVHGERMPRSVRNDRGRLRRL